MAVDNRTVLTTFQAGEDLDGAQYHAIRLVDGKLANNAETASGILMSKPKTNEHGSIAWRGEIKFAAGAAISKGDKVTITTSGWLTTAGSLDTVTGEAKEAITSGSIGLGMFAGFPSVTDHANFAWLEVTPTVNVKSGTGYCLRDGQCADNGEEAAGAALADISSGVAGKIGVYGIMPVCVADVTSAGDPLSVTTSGYFSIADSGYYQAGRALTNINSGLTGSALFVGGTFGYLPL